jgi:hypothetical protein
MQGMQIFPLFLCFVLYHLSDLKVLCLNVTADSFVHKKTPSETFTFIACDKIWIPDHPAFRLVNTDYAIPSTAYSLSFIHNIN